MQHINFPAGAAHSSVISHGATLKHSSPIVSKSGHATLQASTGSGVGATVVASGASVVSRCTSGAAVVVALTTSGFDGVVAAGPGVAASVAAGLLVVGLMVAGLVVASGTAVVETIGAAVVVCFFGRVVDSNKGATVVARSSPGEVVVVATASGGAVVEHDSLHGLHNGTPQIKSAEIDLHQSGHDDTGLCVVVAAEGNSVVASCGAAVGATVSGLCVVVAAEGISVVASCGAADGATVSALVGAVVVNDSGAAVVVCSLGATVVAKSFPGEIVVVATASGGEVLTFDG
jgi:hypothetical protein